MDVAARDLWVPRPEVAQVSVALVVLCLIAMAAGQPRTGRPFQIQGCGTVAETLMVTVVGVLGPGLPELWPAAK